MAAAYGTMILSHPNTPSKEVVALYFDDTAGNPVRFNRMTKAGTASPDNMVFGTWTGIEDINITAASGQTTTTISRNDVTISVITNANHLVAVTTRPQLDLVFPPGGKLTMYQVA